MDKHYDCRLTLLALVEGVIPIELLVRSGLDEQGNAKLSDPVRQMLEEQVSAPPPSEPEGK